MKIAVQTDEGTIIEMIELSADDTETAVGRSWLIEEIQRAAREGRKLEKEERAKANGG